MRIHQGGHTRFFNKGHTTLETGDTFALTFQRVSTRRRWWRRDKAPPLKSQGQTASQEGAHASQTNNHVLIYTCVIESQ